MNHGLQEACFNNAVDSLITGGAGKAPDACAEPEKSSDGHVGIERSGLGKVSDFAFCLLRFLGNWDPADTDVSPGSGDESGDNPHRRGFSGPVGSEESKDFSLLYREGEVVYCGLVPKLLGEIVYFDHEL